MNENTSQTATLIVRRESRTVGMLGKVKLALDGQEIGRVGNGEEVRFPILSGSHTLSLPMAIGASPSVSFTAPLGSEVLVNIALGDDSPVELVGVSGADLPLSTEELQRQLVDLESKKRTAERNIQISQDRSSIISNSVFGSVVALGILFGCIFGFLLFENLFVMLGIIAISLILAVPMGAANARTNRQRTMKNAQAQADLIEQDIVRVQQQLSRVEQTGGRTHFQHKASVDEVVIKSDQLETELQKLKAMYDKELISEEEYLELRKKIIASL